ncbi:uncharacterized protein LOC114579177 isoform X1 [Dendrobium catenatum]|uniref:uncharacterized protein LOC114579177 isoform X1 n=1 Tax=Dendrobium catenatum TaxID=906689 RepID=UPI0010A0780A|nr:uncharacterized protein LOC114579177 isoform X1 [Dendrobium catenatum]
MPLILEAFSPLAVIFPVAVDFLAFNILSTMELPITTAPLLPPLFSFRFSSSISGRRVLVALGDRLSSADGIAGTPGLDLVADVDRPGATEVIKFGGASVGKSGWVAGKRERANGETVRLLGLNSGFCFGGWCQSTSQKSKQIESNTTYMKVHAKYFTFNRLELGGYRLEEIHVLLPLSLEELAEKGELFISLLLCARRREEPHATGTHSRLLEQE